MASMQQQLGTGSAPAASAGDLPARASRMTTLVGAHALAVEWWEDEACCFGVDAFSGPAEE